MQGLKRLEINRFIKVLPEELRKDFLFLKDYLKPFKAYLVGGCVRDFILGRKIVDLDIEVFGINEEEFEKLAKRIGAKGVGKSFFVYKFNNHIDLSLPRREKKVGYGHRGFEVSLAKDERIASIRRDFTMNALMLNIEDGNLLDFWGGVEDIKNRIIRVVNKETFVEDSLRVLRAVQFAARLGFKIEKESIKLMQTIDLSDLTKERIFMEFEKLFKAKFLEYGLFYLACLDIDKKILGIDIDRKTFFKIAFEIVRYKKNFVKEMYKFYFLYFLIKWAGLDFKNALKSLLLPNEYKRVFKFQPIVCNRPTLKELKVIAIDIPIKNWLGNYLDGIEEDAKKADIWDKKFDGGIKYIDIVKEGFKGRKIAFEFRKRVIGKIFN